MPSDPLRTDRQPTYPILPTILHRWSPRAMSGETLADEELLPLFEAARWAPSSYNAQPWKFFVSRKQDEKAFTTLFNLLVPFNQEWCKNAAALVVICSRRLFEKNDKPSPTHAFDAGAAWENLAIEGSSRGFVVHGMEGFDYTAVHKILALPEEWEVHAMAAIGKPAEKNTLPQALQEMETPSGRKPLAEIMTFL